MLRSRLPLTAVSKRGLSDQNSAAGSSTILCTSSMGEDIDKHVLRKYEVQQKLGKGVKRAFGGIHSCYPHRHNILQAYGVVWKSVDKKTRDTVALKKIFDAFQNATDAQVLLDIAASFVITIHWLSIFWTTSELFEKSCFCKRSTTTKTS